MRKARRGMKQSLCIGVVAVMLTAGTLAGCNWTPKNFAEGIRVMTMRGGTSEERDTIKDIIPIAQNLAPYQPKPEWQTMITADAVDIMEFISQNRVLVGTVQLSSAISVPSFGYLSLYDVDTGKMLWQTPRPKLAVDTYMRILSQPVILVNGAGSKISHYIALDPETGKVAWEYEVPQSVISRFDQQHGLLILAGKSDVIALRVQDGMTAWRYALSATGDKKAPVPKLELSGNSLYIAGDSITCLTTDSGAVAWAVPNPLQNPVEFIGMTPKGIILGGQKQILSLAPDSGRILWSQTDLQWPVSNLQAPEEAAGLGFFITCQTMPVPSEQKNSNVFIFRLRGIDLASGQWLWPVEQQFDAGVPVYADGKVYISTGSGMLFVGLDARTGRKLSEEPLPKEFGGVTTLPDLVVRHNGNIIVSREMNGVAAFSVKTGKLVWAQPQSGGGAETFWTQVRTNDLAQTTSAMEEILKKNEKDSRYWGGKIAAISYANQQYDKAWHTQYNSPSSSSSKGRYIDPVTHNALTGINDSIADFFLAMSISSFIEGGLKSAATNGLIKRKLIEIQHSQMTHLTSLRGNYWIRPFYKSGNGFTIVNLNTGKRSDVVCSAPSYAMVVYGINTPYLAISPDGERLITNGIGLDSTAYVKYVKFKWGIAYPSLLSYKLGSLTF